MLKDNPRRPEFFDGNVIKHHDLAEFSIGEIAYPAGSERPSHVHERACFHFLLENGYVERQGSRFQDCKRHTLSFQPAGHEHSYRSYDAGSRSLTITIEVERAWLNRLCEYSVRLDSAVNFRSVRNQWLITRLYDEFSAMEADSPLVIEGLMLELAVEVSRHHLSAERRPPLWLKRTTEFLHEHFTESLALRQVATVADVHAVHLARTFRQYYGCTVGEYIRQLRIEYACRQISGGKTPLLEIALAAGFFDQSQFSRSFKRVMGVTPAEYRRAMLPR